MVGVRITFPLIKGINKYNRGHHPSSGPDLLPIDQWSYYMACRLGVHSSQISLDFTYRFTIVVPKK